MEKSLRKKVIFALAFMVFIYASKISTYCSVRRISSGAVLRILHCFLGGNTICEKIFRNKNRKIVSNQVEMGTDNTSRTLEHNKSYSHFCIDTGKKSLPMQRRRNNKLFRIAFLYYAFL